MRDRSLDEFATDDEANEPGVDRDEAGADRDAPDYDVTAADEFEGTDDSVTPARSTYEWSPTGADCADCGARIERRWRDGDELVCEACKPW